MNRYHLLELSDQDWFPSLLFAESMEFLQFFENATNIFGPAAPLLRRALGQTGTRTITDLCSGNGGPWPRLSRYMERQERFPVTVRLTDKTPPNGVAGASYRGAARRWSFHPEPVDATAIPPDMDGFLTFFNSFHHFGPEEARKILCEATRRRQGIAVFEATERSIVSILQILLLLPFIVWGLTPFIRPLRLSRLFWTYILPLHPLIITYDGVVSSLRTYTPEELRRLAADCNAPDYVWETGTTRALKLPRTITYLVGYPADTGNATSDHMKAPCPERYDGEGRFTAEKVDGQESNYQLQ